MLKEGVGEDQANKARIAKLLRFATTHADSDAESVSLAEYVSRMKEGQRKIYYVTADSFAAAKNSPHLEIFRKKGVEVILLHNRVDEWLVSNLPEFETHPLQSVAKGDLDLGTLDDAEEKQALEQAQTTHKDFVEKIQVALGDQVKAVRVSQRLLANNCVKKWWCSNGQEVKPRENKPWKRRKTVTCKSSNRYSTSTTSAALPALNLRETILSLRRSG